MRILAFVLVVALAGLAYVRLAPIRPAAFDIADLPSEVGDYPALGGFTAVRAIEGDGADALARVKAAMLALPRTTVVNADPLAFVTRSRVFGFPDVTVVIVQDDVLIVRGHLVYGGGDMGVNKARVMGVLAAL